MIRFLGKTFLFFVGLYVIVLITATVNADKDCVARAKAAGEGWQSSVITCSAFASLSKQSR
jgi:hypothetical protein